MATMTKKIRAIEPEEEEPLVKPGPMPGPEGRPFDSFFLALVIALVGFGLVMVYSSSAVQMPWRDHIHAYFLLRQLAHVAVGLVLMVGAMKIDYRWYKRFTYPIFMFALFLLVTVLLFGKTHNHAQRWLSIGGFSFQPAEYLKISLIMYMAYSLEKKDHLVKQFSIGIIPHLMLLGLLAGLLLAQPDFGSTVICAVLIFSMLFIAGARKIYIAGVGLFGALVGFGVIMSSSYRRARLMAYLNPDEASSGSNYQVDQSLMSIGSGGLTGKGLGAGHSKLGYVPELWNDFIGAAIGEELGLVGLALVCGLFMALIGRGLKIAWGARDMYGTYLAFGLTTLFGIQATINLSVVTGLLPNKGLTLPFISYGGTSMLFSLFAVGVLLNVSKAQEDPVAELMQRREEEKRQRRKQEKHRRLLEAKSRR